MKWRLMMGMIRKMLMVETNKNKNDKNDEDG